jgi:hypothetical protein
LLRKKPAVEEISGGNWILRAFGATPYTACDHMRAKQHAKQAAEYGTQTQHHGVQAMHHSHEIEARYSGPDIVSPTVGHQPLSQTTKM